MTARRPLAASARRPSAGRPAVGGDDAGLGCRLGELSEAMRQLDALVDRLEAAGADPLARVLSAALRERLDRLLAETRAQEERALLAALSRLTDARTRGTVDRLRVDLGWLAINWHELRPRIDGVACGQSWVDLDALRDGAELFAALVREHVALASSVAAREVPARHVGSEADAAAAH